MIIYNGKQKLLFLRQMDKFHATGLLYYYFLHVVDYLPTTGTMELFSQQSGAYGAAGWVGKKRNYNASRRPHGGVKSTTNKVDGDGEGLRPVCTNRIKSFPKMLHDFHRDGRTFAVVDVVTVLRRLR